MFGRKRGYDRAQLLSDAARAQRKRKYGKAIALYRRVLAREPGNGDIHRRLAPLLAQTKQRTESARSYRRAAEELLRQGFVERAIGVYREATHHIPREGEVWMALADLEVSRGRRVDALQALWAGRRQLRARAERPQAIKLLERAHELEPADLVVSFELAGLLVRSRQRPRARAVLERLAAATHGHELQRVRARQLWLFPGPRTAWRWLRVHLS